ncbi:MAG: chaperonin GroEL [Planctomycetes bacterium]|nr:chaperonin GroEL [Planctomycetota bacterium]
MAKKVTFEKEARDALAQGVAKFARAVKSTLGPRGRTAIVDRGFGSPRVTKDGASVAEDVSLRDPIENVAVRLMQQAAKKTADQAGDGSTTATVLAEAIFSRSMRNVAAGANPLILQRGLHAATQRAIAALETLKTPVKGDAQIAGIAATAANNNAQVGKIIADAIARVGRDGIITIEEGKSFETTVEVVEGMQFDRGYLSQYFVTDEDNAKAILKDPYILVLEEKISNVNQILPILERVLATKKALLIIAEDIDGEALSMLVVNKIRGVLPCAAAKAPGYGDRRKAMLSDIAATTGATAIFKDLGLEPDSIELSHLGTAQRIEITSEHTIIVKGAGKRKDIEERVRQIRMELEQTESDYDKEKLKERLARLVGGVAEIRVGGATETDVKQQKKLYENALNTTRASVEEGVVPGGGVALLRCIEALADVEVADGDERTGVQILRSALEAPFRQLAANAGEEPSQILRKIRAQKSDTYGFDFEKKQGCDMMKAGIIDSLRVTRTALKNAASVAGMLITTDCVVTEIPSKKKAHDPHHHDDMDMDGDMDY